jgi:tRNA nucleotidyltransferase (CCA-adding enzyme)
MMETTQENPHHKYSVGEHTLKAIEAIRADKVLRLTMLFHDIGKPVMKKIDDKGIAHFKMHDSKGAEMTKQILRRLKFDNDTMNKVVRLVQYHDYRMPAEPKNVRRAMNKIGEDIFPYYLEVRMADTLAQSEYLQEEKIQNIRDVRIRYKEILEKKECVSLKTLAVTGSDLIANGMKPGKEIGEVLNKLLEYVIEHPEVNEKETLLKLKDTL